MFEHPSWIYEYLLEIRNYSIGSVRIWNIKLQLFTL